MFGFTFQELIIPFLILIVLVVIHKAGGIGNDSRRCLVCGYDGSMKTWLSNYSIPLLIAIIGLFFYIIPGFIFIIWAWGKYKCPHCGALGKNVPLAYAVANTGNSSTMKKCPYCAESINSDAIKCRYCSSLLEK